MMTNIYAEIYGSLNDTPEGLRSYVERCLGIEFRERYGDNWGGEYLQADGVEGEEFKIVENFWDSVDDEPYFEPDYPVGTILLYVDETARADYIRQTLSGIPGLQFLYREVRSDGVTVATEEGSPAWPDRSGE